MLRIGLTPCFMYKDPARNVFGHKNLTYMENDMVNYVSKYKNLPLLIPELSKDMLEIFLKQCDGVIFQGGSDLSPLSYGKDFLDKEKWPGDHFRDLYEFKILDYCVKHKIPIFGICRGLQLINAYFKGTLHQDLSTNTKTKVEHRCASKYDNLHHSVKLENNLLKEIYKKDIIEVNSIHHQGIDKLGHGLIKEASCPDDNLIEAFTYENMKEHYILAVQWHPEFSKTLGEKIVSPSPLIENFIQAVKDHKGKE
jgi:putative glutamine amidotransferase